MQYVTLGKSGLTVSRIALGMMSYGSPAWRDWVLGEDESRPIVQRAVELGITLFDTANVYSAGISEVLTGRLLREFFASRDEYVVATKVCQPMGDRPTQRGLSRKHILESIDASLGRLGMDYVDLYQVHRLDPATPIEETLEALHCVVKAGKALYIGASSMYAWEFAKALFTADIYGYSRFISMQNHYNLIYREEEREMIPLCVDQGIGVIPWSPLARGFLVENRTRERDGESTRSRSDAFAHYLYYHEADFAIADRLRKVAERLSLSRAQVALAWILGKPGITSPILGASELHHVEEAVTALDVRLTPNDIAYLEEIYAPKTPAGLE